jgi:hypothetical protein
VPVIWVVVVVVLALSFVLAAVVVGREARRLGRQRHQPVYRLDEAVAYVSDTLPFESAAQLTPDEVRTLLRWHLDALQFQPGSILDLVAEEDEAAAHPSGPVDADQLGQGDLGPLVVSDRDAVSALARQARMAGLQVGTPDVEAVVRQHHAYLLAIGAIDEVPRPIEVDHTDEDDGPRSD